MTKDRKPRTRLSTKAYDALLEEATVDAHGESEQAVGWFTMLEQRLALPFKTTLLGLAVSVTKLEMRDDDQIVAICSRRSRKQAIPISDLPIPTPEPVGVEWIDGYLRWRMGFGFAAETADE